MKVRLLHRDRDLDLRHELPRNEAALAQDLELNTLWGAMAGDDSFLFSVARYVLLSGIGNGVETVLYRQAILKDCLRNAAVIREVYDLTVDALDRRRQRWLGIASRYPAGILSDAVNLLDMFMGVLRNLRGIAAAHASGFASEGFTQLFAMIERELSDEYLANVQGHLTQLKFRKGVLLSAELAEGNVGTNYVLRQTSRDRRHWLKRLLGRTPSAYTFKLHPRDEAGARILSDLQSYGINRVANALAQSADHVRSFFEILRTELGFYVACLNLHERLTSKGEPVCFPHPVSAGERRLRFSGLYDPCLSLLLEHRVVGNDADADGKAIVIITGANQGGKSVFLRSVGVAQLMMQCGMFVAAKSYEAELCTGLFTHYKREEDATMTSGKLDEELARMSDMAEDLRPNAMLLCNESFAATNQREGSEIAGQIVSALLERRIKVVFVTHLYECAHGLTKRKAAGALFLRAERKDDGTRTFKLVEGEPLETSYGEDLYRQVFPAGTGECGTR